MTISFELPLSLHTSRRGLWSAVLVASASLNQACERQGAPPCPIRAEALIQPIPDVAPEIVQRYFPGTTAREFSDAEWAVGELLRYGEAPLAAAPGTDHGGAYRVQMLGGFGWVIRLENEGAHRRFWFKHRHTCEDEYGFGAVQATHQGVVLAKTWRQIDECMTHTFWKAPVQDRPPAEDAEVTVIEGIRGDQHHVIWRQGLYSSESAAYAALTGCIDQLKEAAGWVRSPNGHFIVP